MANLWVKRDCGLCVLFSPSSLLSPLSPSSEEIGKGDGAGHKVKVISERKSNNMEKQLKGERRDGGDNSKICLVMFVIVF